MNKRSVLSAPHLLLVLAALVLAACAGQTGALQPEAETASTGSAEPEGLPETGGTDPVDEGDSATPAAVSHGNEIGGYTELVDALRGAGATVEPAGQVEQAFFGPTGQLIKVNGVDVQVFEYPDATARTSDSSLISEDGSAIGTSMVTWVDQPNFWAKDRVIVLYIGKDPEMISLLVSLLGEPITTHSAR